jgi:hypothetical protein
LASHLRGVLVFTTHGSDGEHRLRQHEDALGITEEDADRILTILEKSGYAYVDYPGRAGYGKSFVRPFKQAALVEKSGMRLINFRDRYWARRQDVYACVPAQTSPSSRQF